MTFSWPAPLEDPSKGDVLACVICDATCLWFSFQAWDWVQKGGRGSR